MAGKLLVPNNPLIKERRPVISELTVKLFADGGVNVEGPLHDKILCYGLLEVGRDAVAAHNPPMLQQPEGIQ